MRPIHQSGAGGDTPAGANPFLLGNEGAYRRWREWKLRDYPQTAEDLVIEVRDPYALTPSEAGALRGIAGKTNMAIYATGKAGADKGLPRALAAQLGLQRLDHNPLADDDGITSLQVAPGKSGRGYIPYSNQRLLWHTDGYYNPPERRLRAFLLHCASAAAEGGENALLDPEIAYALMRDANPDYIRALMADDAMTIPANTEEGIEARAAQTGPVFSVDPRGGSLHMRYTARTRSIEWKQDELTLAAVRFLEALLAGDCRYILRTRLEAGQGLVCNNVLHNRAAFADNPVAGQQRLMFRARFYDRIAGTGLREVFA